MSLVIKAFKQSQKDMGRRLRDQLIMDYASMVGFIAKSIHRKLPQHIELDDLVSTGMIGLMDAIAKFDPKRSNKFKTYAEFRIRGAILDSLREQDLLSRRAREHAREIARVEADLERRLARKPTKGEIAEAMGISLQDFYGLEQGVCVGVLVEYDEGQLLAGDVGGEQFGDGPLWEIISKHSREALSAAIAALPGEERVVIGLYYYEQLNLKEIGAVLGVSESRVSQIHQVGLRRLRNLASKLFTLVD